MLNLWTNNRCDINAYILVNLFFLFAEKQSDPEMVKYQSLRVHQLGPQSSIDTQDRRDQPRKRRRNTAPELMREHNCIMPDDYKEFASWLISLEKTPNRLAINHALRDFKNMRLVRWHVTQAPDGIIPSNKSMLLYFITFIFYLSCHRD